MKTETHRWLLATLATAFLAPPSLAQDGKAQVWTSADGTTISGTFLRLEGKNLLVSRNSQEVSIPFALLSTTSLEQAANLANIASSNAAGSQAGPWSDGIDLSVWPNQTSRSNGDRWLVANHETIRQLRPRLLIVNFSNSHQLPEVKGLVSKIVEALAESSRYHGYAADKSAAPVFLKYEIFKFVDLRDSDRKTGDSRMVPVKNSSATSGFNMKYADFFCDKFAALYGVRDTANPARFLRLDELLDKGYCHEVWLCLSGEPEHPHIGAYEVVEMKPVYDDKFQPTGAHTQSGNGGDDAQPWTGRSVRICGVNLSRGAGCFMESLAHGIEGTSNSNAIPYFSKYFRDYAGFNLNEKYNAPFYSYYAAALGTSKIVYSPDGSISVPHNGTSIKIFNYICAGGNVHFTPNGRYHYDLDNSQPVQSTIEDWRIGSGPNGADLAKPFTNAAFKQYQQLAPDCMGPWLVYWRQNMPGLDNKQKDLDGKPMKNWWPFLFY